MKSIKIKSVLFALGFSLINLIAFAQPTSLTNNASYGQRYQEQLENNTAKPNAPSNSGARITYNAGATNLEMFEKGYYNKVYNRQVQERVDAIKFKERQEVEKKIAEKKELEDRVRSNYLYNKELKQQREVTLTTKTPLYENGFSITADEAREVAEIQYYFQYNGSEFPYDDYEAASKFLYRCRSNIDLLGFDSLMTLVWQGNRYAETAINCIDKLRKKFPQKIDSLDKAELRTMVNYFGGYRPYFYDTYDNNYPYPIINKMTDSETKNLFTRFKILSDKYPSIAQDIAGITRVDCNPFSLMVVKKDILKISETDIFEACKKALYTNYSSNLKSYVKKDDWPNYVFTRIWKVAEWLVKNKMDYVNSLTISDWLNIKNAQNVGLEFFKEPFKKFNETSNQFEYPFTALNDAINGATIGGKKINSNTYKYDDGTTYVGEFKNEIFEGKGTITYADGEKYTGDFVNYQFDGIGTYVWKDGGRYEGEYKNGQRQGIGKRFYKDGSIYKGQWGKSLKEGKGTMQYGNKDVYEGYWKNDVRDSTGTYIWADGGIYAGTWKSNQMDGIGEKKYSNGTTYSGGWKNDKHDGFGTKNFNNGERYSGDWKENKKDGKGIYTWGDSVTYTGDFKNDLKEGFGKITNKNGVTYEGNFKENKRSGKGILKYANGDVYNGDFVNNVREGYGEFKTALGDTYKGTYVNSKKDGKGIYNSGDSIKYDGGFKNGMFDGFGKLNYSNGAYYEGQFKANQKDGVGTYKYSNGDVYIGEFINDKREGKGKVNFINGIVYEGEFKNNLREGQGKYTKANGFYMEGTFKNNLRDIVKYYTKQGQETTKEDFEK